MLSQRATLRKGQPATAARCSSASCRGDFSPLLWNPMATIQQPDSFKSSPAYVKAGWGASKVAVLLQLSKICFSSGIWYQRVNVIRHSALLYGKRGHRNTRTSQNLAAGLVCVVQWPAPCPWISKILFSSREMDTRKGRLGIRYRVPLFPTRYKSLVQKSFWWEELCKWI